MMRTGRHGLFDKLGDNEDWNSRLRIGIQCAELDSTDDELKECLAALKRKLDSSDECFHIVTATMDIPNRIHPHFFEKGISELLAATATVAIRDDGRIDITSEMRGSKSYVKRHATVLIQRMLHHILHKHFGRNQAEETSIEVTLRQPKMAQKNSEPVL